VVVAVVVAVMPWARMAVVVLARHLAVVSSLSVLELSPITELSQLMVVMVLTVEMDTQRQMQLVVVAQALGHLVV
jgi:hypothetical protein